jgi:hypothetical protein
MHLPLAWIVSATKTNFSRGYARMTRIPVQSARFIAFVSPAKQNAMNRAL